jgi:hypothetical protein
MDVVDLGPCRAFWSEGGPRTAVFVPGRLGGSFQPAFAYLRELLGGVGWSVLAVNGDYETGDPVEWVRARTRAALAYREPTLFVGKSLASFAADLVHVPAVWLTPLVGEAAVRDGIAPPALLVGGTADPSWDAGFARSLGVQVVELERVDHGLVVEGDVEASLDAMRRLVQAVAAFATPL